MSKTTLRLTPWLAIGLLAVVSAQAGSLDPPPGSVSPTRPPDTCYDNTGNRFVDCGDGTIKDTETGLYWLKNANCFGLENWADANTVVAELAHGQCGLTDGSLPGDWRLPTIEEWQVIIDAANANGCGGPTVPDVLGTGCCGTGTCAFSGVQSSNYWSATTNAGNPNSAWYAILGFGTVGTANKTNSIFVWPVRGGP